MSLFPDPTPANPVIFSTYDLEWWSSCSPDCSKEHEHNFKHPKEGKLRMVGVYDDRGFRKYWTIKDFLKGELHEKNYDRVFFAHAGGKFDFLYVFEELVNSGLAKTRYHIEAIFNGASAFLVTVNERLWRGKYRFCDSMFLLKGSLRDIGKKLGEGFYKGDFDFLSEDDEAMVVYNEQDCRVLYKALKRLQSEIGTLGGQMKPTLASSAMNLFCQKFLKHPLRTHYQNSQEVRNAYYASRVEVFRPLSAGGFHYDINSSFPWSMTQTLPGEFQGTISRLPDDPCEHPVIAEMTVEVSEEFLTVVPYRDPDRRILFPTGTWRSYFAGPDIRLMLKTGVKIKEVHQIFSYAPFRDLGAYVHELYALKARESGFKREVYKLLLNALYGKFGEKQAKEKLLIYPKTNRCTHEPEHENDFCMRMVRPHFYMRQDFSFLEHVHVPIPAFVTAYSRELLYNFLMLTKEFYYVDTDSIDCGPEDGNLPVGEELGALKLEHKVQQGEWISPKLYRLRVDGKSLIKSKGFSKLNDASFDLLLTGAKFPLDRQRSLRESIRSGDFKPSKKRVEKRVVVRPGMDLNPEQLVRRTKRCIDFEGNTSRPWTVKEILNAYE